MTVTLINPFVVPPDQEADFVASWRKVATALSAQPGYLDARLHRSLDRNARFRFVNVAHWDSQNAWAEAMQAFPSDGAPADGIVPNPALYEPVAGEAVAPEDAVRGNAPVTITENSLFTQIVEFEVPADRQAALIRAIAAEVERWVRHRPGFVSSSFHASHDGTRVINYAQWRSEADFRAFVADPESEHIGAAIRRVGGVSGPQATHCRVVRVIKPGSGKQS